jgi:hypothetical protein
MLRQQNYFLRFFPLLFWAVPLGQLAVLADQPLKLIWANKIWDEAPHNAFTDLVRFQDQWFCVFREGQSHVSPDGALRIIASNDGLHWESAALITSENSDLRDAKINVTPDGRLMLCGAEALHDRAEKSHQSLVWFSEDGRQWSDRIEVGDPNVWLWRVTWHGPTAYGVGYGCGSAERFVRLYSSENGADFVTLVDRLYEEGYPNETSIVFDNDTAYCLLRRDGQPNEALLGTAEPPYRQWSWRGLGARMGGPHLILLPDGRMLAAVRLYDQSVRTSLCWIDRENATYTEALRLPSGGDTSYPGLFFWDNHLWVSYYSSHEGKTSIYLAKVDVTPRSDK